MLVRIEIILTYLYFTVQQYCSDYSYHFQTIEVRELFILVGVVGAVCGIYE